ncbi:MAG TPA: hypothetical protein DCS67_10900 [Clostridiales bacterium UBA8960]|nr:hypothetical protein [Clostridiales bacterium UBA8960]
MPKKYFAKKYAFYATQYGGIHNHYKVDETSHHVPLGTAHFLEHQIFEDKEKSNFEKFEALGANLNAYTSSASTVYHFDSVDHFEQGIELLVSMVHNTDISDASVSKEIEVIDQEIRMYMDEPAWDLSNNLYKGLFHDHPIRYEIAGTVESIRDIDKDVILNCYSHFYSPNNMSLFLYGDIEVEGTIEWLENLFAKFPRNNTPKPKLILPDEPYKVKYSRMDVRKNISKGMMLLGFKGDFSKFQVEKEEKIAALKIANDLLFGRSSRFFMDAYEKGVVTDAFDFDSQVGDGYAMSLVGNETDQIDKLYEMILEELRHHQINGFDEDDFIRMQRKITGRTVASFNSLQSIAGNFTQSVMRGNDLFKQMEAYRKLTLSSVNDAVRTFYDLENHTLSAIHKNQK